MSKIAKTGGSPAREVLYAEAASLAPRAIEVLKELLDHKNENVRLGAVKTILAKAIPDLKAIELTGKDGEDLKFELISYGSIINTKKDTV